MKSVKVAFYWTKNYTNFKTGDEGKYQMLLLSLKGEP